jgi:hypothetical protein
MQFLDDNPSVDDKYGFAPTADVIVDAIQSASRRPITVGVFGGWGSGKTSLMQMVEERLKRSDIKTVWFKAWKYSGKEIIWNALIQTVLLAMKNDADTYEVNRREAFKKRIYDTSLELAKYAAKVGTRVIPGGIVKESDVDNLWRIFASSVEDGNSFEFINRFESEFKRLVRDYVGDSYLTVFIDDLDRCLPENAVEVMEALKLYLDEANCVFVIGVEPSIIEAAINERYGANLNLSASRYLEKIVQLPIFVPRVHTQSGLDMVRSAVGDDFLSAHSNALALLIRAGMDRNPRRIKRFSNALAIALSRVPESTVPQQLILCKVLVAQVRFPNFYRELSRDASLMTTLSSDDPKVWDKPGLEDLREDTNLRSFLLKTRKIPSPTAAVARWIRAAEPTDVADMEADVEMVDEEMIDEEMIDEEEGREVGLET